jgi:chromosome segregation ATPase
MALSEHPESIEHHEETSPGSGRADTSRAELDAALRAVEVANGRERLIEEQIERLEARLLETDLAGAEREKEVARLLDLVDEIQHTRSWRWTAPFRFLRRALPF